MSNAKGNGHARTEQDAPGRSSGIRSLFVGSRKTFELERRAVAALNEQYPAVAAILGGLEAEGPNPETEPGSITFFVREGKIRWSANVKSADTTLIGEVGDVLNPWGSINTALELGEVSSKRYTERKTSSTSTENPPY